MRSALLLVFTLGVTASAPAAALTRVEHFERANESYFAKRYADARDGYVALVSRFEVRSPVVYFNLGNAHFQLGRYGEAILAYRRALLFSPDDALRAKLKDNVQRAQEAVLERHRKTSEARTVAVLDESHGIVYGLFHALPVEAASIAFSALWVLFFGAAIARRLSANPAVRARLRAVVLIAGVPMALLGIDVAGNLLTSRALSRGIVVAEGTRLRESRHPDAPSSDVPEGLEVAIEDDTDPAATRIRLSNGKDGWVPKGDVVAVEP